MDDSVEAYLTGLAETEHDDPVLGEMEALAAENGFPIVGRATGRYLELAARMIGARRVMELGSGYGYSAYWFARAVGTAGEVVCTDGNAGQRRQGRAVPQQGRPLGPGPLPGRRRAGRGSRAEQGEFDIVYCDVDKLGYPDCWQAARDRIRVGGLWLCDNVIWSGHVATGTDRDGLEGLTAAIRQHNAMVAEDDRYVGSIIPIRDGVMTALRIR